jgi:Ca2+-binding EF-hand superfamily protein
MAELVDEKFSEYELAEMFMEADKDGDGEVTEQDFLRIMKRTVRLCLLSPCATVN